MGLLRETSSRDRQKSLLFALLAVLFVLLYLLLFPRPLTPELTLVPAEATPLGELRAEKLAEGGSFFAVGGWEGYWGPEGKLLRAEARRPQAAASAGALAWFDAPHNQLVVEGTKGVRFTLPGEAYPTWSEGRLFTLDENRLGLKAWDAQGRLVWAKHFSSLITALDTSAALTVVGTLDGRLQVFGPKGEASGGFQPGGSRLPVIYNVAASPKDRSILVLAGVDPKRFLVLERGGSEFRPVFHKPLKESRPWPTPLGFLNGGELAYYETEGGLAFLNPASPERESVVPVKGSPLVLVSLPKSRLVAFLESQGDQSSLRIASPSGAPLLTAPFQGTDLMLQLEGNNLMVAADQTLLRLEVRAQ